MNYWSAAVECACTWAHACIDNGGRSSVQKCRSSSMTGSPVNCERWTARVDLPGSTAAEDDDPIHVREAVDLVD
jgi:hypothetical protein